jgi:hypothetical protein
MANRKTTMEIQGKQLSAASHQVCSAAMQMCCYRSIDFSHSQSKVGLNDWKINKEANKIATIFVDHYSTLDYIYSYESTSAEDTIKAI